MPILTEICLRSSNFIQWPLPSLLATSSLSSSNPNDVELTRNQLDDLKKKMTPIQEIILSLQPKKKYPLIGYLPDFESYDNDLSDSEANNLPSLPLVDMDDHEVPGSLSERLYKELDGQTTRKDKAKGSSFHRFPSFSLGRFISTTPVVYHRVKSVNQSSLLTDCCALNLTVLLLVSIHRLFLFDL